MRVGLDQYAFRLKARPPTPTDFKVDDYAGEGTFEDRQLFYWRKHPNLQGWMENLYYAKGGKKHPFNCTPVLIEAEDLDQLEEAVRQETLPYTTGFFFGTSQPQDSDATLEFIAKARQAIKEGSCIAYDSWW
jgi:hypothetical protein